MPSSSISLLAVILMSTSFSGMNKVGLPLTEIKEQKLVEE
jgi:hypothetical protein